MGVALSTTALKDWAVAKRLMTAFKDEANGREVEKKPRITQKAEAGTFASEIFGLLVECFMTFLLYPSYFAQMNPLIKFVSVHVDDYYASDFKRTFLNQGTKTC